METISTRFKNWKLQRRRQELEKISNLVALEARKKGEDIYEEWRQTEGFELHEIDDEIKHNISSDLIKQAEKLMLPTPSLSDSEKSYKRECQEKNLPLGWVPIIFLSRHSAQLFERALSL